VNSILLVNLSGQYRLWTLLGVDEAEKHFRNRD